MGYDRNNPGKQRQKQKCIEYCCFFSSGSQLIPSLLPQWLIFLSHTPRMAFSAEVSPNCLINCAIHLSLLAYRNTFINILCVLWRQITETLSTDLIICVCFQYICNFIQRISMNTMITRIQWTIVCLSDSKILLVIYAKGCLTCKCLA